MCIRDRDRGRRLKIYYMTQTGIKPPQMCIRDRPKAPGMKYRHYAPKAPVTVVTGDSRRTRCV